MQNIFDAMKEFQQSVWRAVYLTGEDHKLLYQHHKNIFEAIRNRDPEAARTAMAVHLNFAEQRSSAYVTQQQR
jgi:GntR family transcriptional repressor for pyruvate dehydrogenase complex